MREQAEWETAQARLDAERQQLEHDFCLARREAVRDQVKSQIRDKIQSKVAFNVTHALEVGELEVDVEQLQEMLKEREKQPLQEPDRAPFQDDGPVQKGCSCMERECGCRPGLLKRHCPRCCVAQCEPGCGGPQAFRQAMRQPLRQPLRPAEIPLKLPVKLAFGMQNPELEETKIRKEPITVREPFRDQPPCDQCPDHPAQKPYQKYTSVQKTAADGAAGDTNGSTRTAQRPTLPTPIPEPDVAEDPMDATRSARNPTVRGPTPDLNLTGEFRRLLKR